VGWHKLEYTRQSYDLAAVVLYAVSALTQSDSKCSNSIKQGKVHESRHPELHQRESTV
jgi:hypothetical protein